MKNILNKKIAMTMIVTTSLMMATSSFGANLKSWRNPEDKKWGFKSSSGEVAIQGKYDGVGEFVNGYAAVSLNKLWGAIDEKGKEIVPIKYDGVGEFHGGKAPVIKNGVWGMINELGEEVISFKYQEIFYFDSEGNANAKKDGKWGKIDQSENIIVPFMYDEPDRLTKYKESKSKIVLDGEEIELNAYNINNNNYVQIRDFAKVVNGSQKQFEVSWDQQNKMIDLISGQSYTEIDEKPHKKVVGSAKFTQSPIAKDGEKIIIKGYNLGDNNYFKIADLAETFNIGINWNQKTKTVEIDTTADYTK